MQPDNNPESARPIEPVTPIDKETGKLAVEKLDQLKELYEIAPDQLRNMSNKKQNSINRKQQSIKDWFAEQLGENEEEMRHRADAIEQYILSQKRSDAQKRADFFYTHIVGPHYGRIPSQIPVAEKEKDPPVPEAAEDQGEKDLERFKKAAERGVIVQRKTEDSSDLDGNVAVMLMKRAGVITDSTPVFYVEHEQLDKFMAKHPEIAIMIDISPEEAAGMDHGQHRDGLASSLTPDGGRIYFDHHGPASDPKSPSAARQVYEHLIRLGALTDSAPTQNLLDFVDAQDNKNYYSADFDIVKTARNAFGLMQLQVDRDGKFSHFLHQVDPATKELRPGFISLMELTGKDPAKSIPNTELNRLGIDKAMVQQVEKHIKAAVKQVDKLREQGMIIKTRYGSELMIDIDKSATKYLHSIDYTDVLYAAGIKTRVSYFRQPSGEYTLFVASNDPKIKVAQLAKRFGGLTVRNMYFWQLWREGQGAPRPMQLAEELDVEPEELKKITKLEAEYPRTVYEETIKQKNEKGCVLACLANIAKYVFGEDAAQIEGYLRSRLGKDFDETKGTNIAATRKLIEKLGYAAIQPDNFDELRQELEAGIEPNGKGRGAIMWVNRHATALYLQLNRITKQLEIVYHDPRQTPDLDHPSVQVLKYTEENLEKFLSAGRQTGEKPYAHILIVGAEGARPVTGQASRLEDAISKLPLSERIREEHQLNPDIRIQKILDRYRPKADFSKLREDWYQKIPAVSTIMGWKFSSLSLQHPNNVEVEYNRVLAEAHQWETDRILQDREFIDQFLADHPDLFEGDLAVAGENGVKRYHPEYEKALQARIDILEMRYLSECVDVAKQTEVLKASEGEFADRIKLKIEALEQIVRDWGPEWLDAEQTHEYLRPKELQIQKPLTTEGMIGIWGERSDLTTKYYLLIDSLSTHPASSVIRKAGRDWLGLRGMWEDLDWEKELMKSRSALMLAQMRQFDPEEDLKLADAFDAMTPEDRKVFDHMRKELSGDHLYYQKLSGPEIWGKLTYIDGALRSEQAREFIELQRQQTESYYRFLSTVMLIRLLVKDYGYEQMRPAIEPLPPKNRKKGTIPPPPSLI